MGYKKRLIERVQELECRNAINNLDGELEIYANSGDVTIKVSIGNTSWEFGKWVETLMFLRGYTFGISKGEN